jgi:hypothetical protein
VPPELRTLLDQILTTNEWDIKYLGMQILVEGLALAAFGMQNQVSREPLIKDITSRIMQDEARHVAFGVLSLRDHYADMTEAELGRARGVFRRSVLADARPALPEARVGRVRAAGQRDSRHHRQVGDVAPVPHDAVLQDRAEREAARSTQDRLRAQFAKLGILGFEEWEPTA